ncbi:hypothetical protein BDZ97DRAFT_1824980 [Flammula alnicola]|nr:hypothetical protein BDZ97DRAFT_1824980 [Flammula alnicola]
MARRKTSALVAVLEVLFPRGSSGGLCDLTPMLLAYGKQSNTSIDAIVSAAFTQLIDGIDTEHDSISSPRSMNTSPNACLLSGALPSPSRNRRHHLRAHESRIHLCSRLAMICPNSRTTDPHDPAGAVQSDWTLERRGLDMRPARRAVVYS